MTAQTKRESILFLIATYLLTGIAWGTLILLNQPPNSGAVAFSLYLLGGLSPTIISLLLPLRVAKGERKAYYKRYFNFKIPFKWYLLPIAVALLMTFVGFAIVQVFFKEAVQPLATQPWYMIFPLFLQMIIGGGLEELGWRGILVHHFQNKNRILVPLVIGVIWACWHIPLFFIQGVSQYHGGVSSVFCAGHRPVLYNGCSIYSLPKRGAMHHFPRSCQCPLRNGFVSRQRPNRKPYRSYHKVFGNRRILSCIWHKNGKAAF